METNCSPWRTPICGMGGEFCFRWCENGEREGMREGGVGGEREAASATTKKKKQNHKTHRIEVGKDLLERHRRRHPKVREGAGEGRQRCEARGAVVDEGELRRV